MTSMKTPFNRSHDTAPACGRELFSGFVLRLGVNNGSSCVCVCVCEAGVPTYPWSESRRSRSTRSLLGRSPTANEHLNEHREAHGLGIRLWVVPLPGSPPGGLPNKDIWACRPPDTAPRKLILSYALMLLQVKKKAKMCVGDNIWASHSLGGAVIALMIVLQLISHGFSE